MKAVNNRVSSSVLLLAVTLSIAVIYYAFPGNDFEWSDLKPIWGRLIVVGVAIIVGSIWVWRRAKSVDGSQ